MGGRVGGLYRQKIVPPLDQPTGFSNRSECGNYKSQPQSVSPSEWTVVDVDMLIVNQLKIENYFNKFKKCNNLL